MTAPTNPTPEVITHQLAADGPFPNNPSLPLVIYKQSVLMTPDEPAEMFEHLFEANGWGGCWVNGVFSFHHYHSNAHEVLGICDGSADIQFGGSNGPVLEVEAGDVVILPAGTAHMKVKAAPGFELVGAYPERQEDYDMMRGEPGERAQAEANIAAVPLPATDPVYGAQGPLFDYW